MKRAVKWLWPAANDRGAALVTVLLIVTVMAAGAALTFETTGYSIKRGTARQIYDQARFYALGGEQLALASAEQIRSNDIHLTQPVAVSYPIDGGRIEGVLSDASNCFNVNSLVERLEGGTFVQRPEVRAQYVRLVVALGFADRDALQLAATLGDWLDSDTRPTLQGAEDYDYSGLDVPYRAANGLMRDISELHNVAAYDAETVARLLPYLCADNGTDMARLNVNTLSVIDAPLLAAIVAGDFTVENAADAIAARPVAGYDAVADFWRSAAFSGRNIPQNARLQVDVKPYLFESNVRVQYYDATRRITSLISIANDGTARLVSRRFGVTP